MTLSQEDHFILAREIRDIQERLDYMRENIEYIPSTGMQEMHEEFSGMIRGLMDVVIELSKEVKK